MNVSGKGICLEYTLCHVSENLLAQTDVCNILIEQRDSVGCLICQSKANIKDIMLPYVLRKSVEAVSQQRNCSEHQAIGLGIWA